MYYVKSDKINVFPLSKNRLSNEGYNSRALLESRIANTIRQLIDVSGFVISDNVNVSVGSNNLLTFNDPFLVNLYGYFIEIEKDASITITENSSAVWMCLTTDINGEITGQDNTGTGEYEGIKFTTDEVETDTSTAKLKILEKTSGVWNIPNPSKTRFSVSSVIIDRIDGKH